MGTYYEREKCLICRMNAEEEVLKSESSRERLFIVYIPFFFECPAGAYVSPKSYRELFRFR